eukprot:8224924-Pyramimonas_sp.AAC.1
MAAISVEGAMGVDRRGSKAVWPLHGWRRPRMRRGKCKAVWPRYGGGGGAGEGREAKRSGRYLYDEGRWRWAD